MKKQILLTGLLFFSFVLMGQKSKLNSSSLTINNFEILGQTKTEILNKFGNPSSIKNVYLEMEDKQAEKFNYNGLTILLVDDFVNGFEITSPSFASTPNQIKVGDSVSVLSSIFPDSYKNRLNSGIHVDIEDQDFFLIFSYNNEFEIKKIALYQY